MRIKKLHGFDIIKIYQEKKKNLKPSFLRKNKSQYNIIKIYQKKKNNNYYMYLAVHLKEANGKGHY